jgi:hypothetical protein
MTFMDFLFAKNESFNIASIQHEEGGGGGEEAECCNPILAKCGGEAQHLEKVKTWSPPGLPNV